MIKIASENERGDRNEFQETRSASRSALAFGEGKGMGSLRIAGTKNSGGDVALQAALEHLQAADEPNPGKSPVSRTLPVATPFYRRYHKRQAVFELGEKPEVLGDGSVTERAWHNYQAYLNRVRPVARAEFYKRLLERNGCKSIRALSRITGEDHSRIARVLKVLELPEPILDYLRTCDIPAVVGYFTEHRLRDLIALRDPAKAWDGFQAMLKEIPREVAVN